MFIITSRFIELHLSTASSFFGHKPTNVAIYEDTSPSFLLDY